MAQTMKREHEPPHQPIMQGGTREKMKVTILNGNPDYWDNQLKGNGVYEKRFARPYAE